MLFKFLYSIHLSSTISQAYCMSAQGQRLASLFHGSLKAALLLSGRLFSVKLIFTSCISLADFPFLVVISLEQWHDLIKLSHRVTAEWTILLVELIKRLRHFINMLGIELDWLQCEFSYAKGHVLRKLRKLLNHIFKGWISSCPCDSFSPEQFFPIDASGA